MKNGVDLGIAYELDKNQFERIGLKPQICGKGFNVECRFDDLEFPVPGYKPIGDIDVRDTPQGITGTRGKRQLQCLILEPTRDLAEQTYKCITKYSKYLDNPVVKTALFVGGVDEREQQRALTEGVDICCGTLQKTMDHIRRGKLDISQVKLLVLDEADDLQKKDEGNHIVKLNAQIKKGRRDRVQTLFFSATLHTPEVQQMIQEITTRPIWVDLKGKDSVPDTVHHVVVEVDPKQELYWKPQEIAIHSKPLKQAGPQGIEVPTDEVHAIKSMSPLDSRYPQALELSHKIKQQKFQLIVKIADSFKMTQCLVFCRTNVDCNNLEKYLNHLGTGSPTKGWTGIKAETGKENPYSCCVLAGMRDQDERRQNLAAFKEGDMRFMICTDVAARGIDIVGLPFLIMCCLPDDIENYIHRVGRVGRAERVGLAISLVATEKEKVWYHKCSSRGKNCQPWPGNTRLTIPYAPQAQKLVDKDEANWIIDEGGCCIWYNEPDLRLKVEKRIQMPLKPMSNIDFSIPGLLESPLDKQELEMIQNRVKGGGNNNSSQRTSSSDSAEAAAAAAAALEKSRRAKLVAQGSTGIVFGQKAEDETASSTKRIVSELVSCVKELSTLERYIQQHFCVGLSRGGAANLSNLVNLRNGKPVQTGTKISKMINDNNQQGTSSKGQGLNSGKSSGKSNKNNNMNMNSQTNYAIYERVQKRLGLWNNGNDQKKQRISNEDEDWSMGSNNGNGTGQGQDDWNNNSKPNDDWNTGVTNESNLASFDPPARVTNQDTSNEPENPFGNFDIPQQEAQSQQPNTTMITQDWGSGQSSSDANKFNPGGTDATENSTNPNPPVVTEPHMPYADPKPVQPKKTVTSWGGSRPKRKAKW